MNTKALFIAPITALLLSMSGAGLTATNNDDNATVTPMGQQMGQRMGMGPGMGPGMGQGMGWGMGPGVGMGPGMMGMMGNCPMMSAEGGLNRKAMMQMHGEMMRAMGEIMIKYADKIETPASSE